MATFFISYDLIKDKNYNKLYDKLETIGSVRILNSLWCLKSTTMTSTTLRDNLTSFVDGDDRLLIVESSSWAGRNLLRSPNDL